MSQQNEFFSKESSKAYEQIKVALYERLKVVEEHMAYADTSRDEDDIDGETWSDGWYDRAVDEHDFLLGLIDKLERS
jgi:hypothetical protein